MLEVASLVISHVPLRGERFVAGLALEWLLVRVDPDVYFEVGSLRELLIASDIGAAERL